MHLGGYNRLTLQDYPAQTAAICFTTGCQLRCPYCHNAGLVLMPETDTVSELHHSNSLENEFLSYIDKRHKQLDGVVISGGEPLLQNDLEEFIKRIRSYGLKIKLDTNGLLPERLTRLINLNLVDYVAMDYKNCRAHYAETVGLNKTDYQRQYAEHAYEKWYLSLRCLRNSGVDYELRTTVARELHPTDALLIMADELGADGYYDERWYLQSFTSTAPIIADYTSSSELKLSAYSEIEMSEIRNLLRTKCLSVRLRSEQIA